MLRWLLMGKVTIHEKAEYLSDTVLAASDGIVTTFAIVAGSAGASLDIKVVLILGLANLFADGISMAAGRYLGIKSEIEYEESKGRNASSEGPPVKHSLFTFISFVLAGFVPLAPFIFVKENPYVVSVFFVGLALFLIGFLKSIYTKVNFLRSGMESFVIGGFASLVAFTVGYLLRNLGS